MTIASGITEIKYFLGMVKYYGKCLHNMSYVLVPLHDLFKKNNKFV